MKRFNLRQADGGLRLAGGLLSSLLVVGLAPVVASAQNPGPQMPDPRQMSGISRVDPALPAGEVTVRCLLGGFSEPAVGVEVTLEITTPAGETVTRSTVAEDQGRASFSDLGEFIGGSAIASVRFGEELVRSQPIPLAAQGGSRLLLVKGASGAAAAAGAAPADPAAAPTAGNPHSSGAAGDLPPFGEAFELTGRPPGIVVVGALTKASGDAPADAPPSFGGIQPTPGLVVRLFTVDAEGNEALLKTAETDVEGRAAFVDLEVPAELELIAEAELSPDGPPQRSKPFSIAESSKAVVLIEESLRREIEATAAAAGASAQPAPPDRPVRRPLPPVRRDANVPTGVVDVLVLDANDSAVAAARVEVVRVEMGGAERSFPAETGPDGKVRVDSVEALDSAIYYVRVVHDDAPYKTGYFELPPDVGVSAALRVFDRTDDPSRVRSAAHFELDALENDKARLLIGYEILVTGDEAFWPRGGMQLWGPEGVTVAKPLDESAAWLEEVDGAPYAQLRGPIPPGEVARLSMAFVLPHDGVVEVDWNAPFPLIESRVILDPEQNLVDTATQGPPELIEHQAQPGQAAPAPEDILRVQTLAAGESRPDLCAPMRAEDPDFDCPPSLTNSAVNRVRFSMTGFPKRPRGYWWSAIGVGVVVVLGAGLSMLLRPREDRVVVLRRRRDELLRRLAATSESDREVRSRTLRALDRIYHQLETLGALESNDASAGGDVTAERKA